MYDLARWLGCDLNTTSISPMSRRAPSFEALRRRIQAAVFGGMAEQLERLRWSAEQIAAHQRQALRTLLGHAAAHSPFQARRLAGVDPARVDLGDLARLPVMTKAEMMDRFDDVVTDRRLSRGLVEDTLARTTDEPIALLDEYICQASGGSSGRRGIFVVDVDAMVAFVGALLRSAATLPGGLPARGLRIGFVAAPSAVHATGIAPHVMAGSPVRYFPAPAVLPLAEIVARLNAIQPDALSGYASMLVRLAGERRAGRLSIAPALIRSTSETLPSDEREAIAAAFQAPVVDTFGSSEGLVGSSDPNDPVLVFASDGSIVELVDERRRPVPAGEPSARILLTNITNRVQPLIRYEIEDSFVEQPRAVDHGHLRAVVRGRSDEILRYGAIEVHPLVVRSVLVKTPDVADYQVRQTARGIEVTLVPEGDVDVPRLAARLRAALSEAGLRDAEVVLRTVPALQRQAGTGKLRRFIPA